MFDALLPQGGQIEEEGTRRDEKTYITETLLGSHSMPSTSHKPLPTDINNQLIPILENHGVPFEALKQLLEEHFEEDLGELFRIFKISAEVRKWVASPEGEWRGRIYRISVVGLPRIVTHETSTMLLFRT
jgi:hypothetical protein